MFAVLGTVSVNKAGGGMKKDRQKDMISTFIGTDVSVEGIIKFKGTIRLDGNVEGKIYSDKGTVIVGEKAVINADMHVDVAIISGLGSLRMSILIPAIS